MFGYAFVAKILSLATIINKIVVACQKLRPIDIAAI
jgi:hypothetical protein